MIIIVIIDFKGYNSRVNSITSLHSGWKESVSCIIGQYAITISHIVCGASAFSSDHPAILQRDGRDDSESAISFKIHAMTFLGNNKTVRIKLSIMSASSTSTFQVQNEFDLSSHN